MNLENLNQSFSLCEKLKEEMSNWTISEDVTAIQVSLSQHCISIFVTKQIGEQLFDKNGNIKQDFSEKTESFAHYFVANEDFNLTLNQLKNFVCA